MSAVDTRTIEHAPPPEVAEAQQTRHKIFRYSAYVHVGEGAADCEHGEDGACRDDGHVHLWCRLPNPYQVRDITEKARAARARRVRMLKDEGSDAYVTLEQELDELRDESLREVIVGELVDKYFAEDYTAAIREVADIEVADFVPDDEHEEVPKLYANIDQDREEYERQKALEPEQREDDFAELEKTVAAWSKAVDESFATLQGPRRRALNERPMDELVEMVRKDRIDRHATESYLHTFNTWQWFVCTFKPRRGGTPNERVFKDVAQFKYETPPDVIAAIQATFTGLEQELAGDRRGNS